MTAEQKDQQEPSMEEILSSIRRIIADEEGEDGKNEEDPELGAAEAREKETDEADDGDEDEDDEDVLELTKVVREGGEVVDLRNDRAETEPDGEEPPSGDDASAMSPTDLPAGDVPEDDEIELEPAARGNGEPAAAQDETEEKAKVSASPAASHDLISENAASAATGAFAKLSHAMQRTPAEESIADDSGRTVEQFMEDMIRPMLKQWLDENMPALVERLVQKEIQKLARRSELM